MKPRHEHEQEGERRSGMADASASERLGAPAPPGPEPGVAAAVVEPRTPTADLAAWLDALGDTETDTDTDAPLGDASADTAPLRVCHEAEELLLALAEVDAAPRARDARPARASLATASASVFARRYDARLLAERLLAESQQHSVLAAAPTDLLAAQSRLDAISEDLLAQLLAGLAAAPLGSDVASVLGSPERGLLALLALQLYVQESMVRQSRRSVDTGPVSSPPVGGERDERLLEVLAVPHAASRPLGERRPRGRPRR